MPEKRHTTTEAAALFGVSRLTVYRWIHAGKLKAGRYGGQWRVTAAEITRRKADRAKG
jgi:excisionase family DNA binding protein